MGIQVLEMVGIWLWVLFLAPQYRWVASGPPNNNTDPTQDVLLTSRLITSLKPFEYHQPNS